MPERVSEVDGKADQTDLYIIVILSFNGDKRARPIGSIISIVMKWKRYADEIAAVYCVSEMKSLPSAGKWR